MAHYAQVINNRVTRVLVMSNDMSDSDCVEWLNQKVSNQGEWLKTSYNGNIRGKYAGIGDEWHPDIDAFVHKPFKSWILDKRRKVYRAPALRPSAKHRWSEKDKKWMKPDDNI